MAGTRREEEPLLAKAKDGASLRKELNVVSGTAVVIGQVIGSGIFITPSTVLCYTKSFGMSLVVWAFSGFIAMIGALCYCELGTLVKKSGSDYAYILEAYSFNNRKPSLQILGSLLGFLNIWSNMLVIEPTGIAVALLTFGQYMSRPFFIGCEVPILAEKMFALFALCALTMVNIYSVKTSAKLMTWLSSLKILACMLIVALGVVHLVRNKGIFPEDSQHPFAGSTTSPANFALAMYSALFAFSGWNALNTVSEETKDVDKTLPRVTVIGIPIVIICYLLMNVAFFAVLTYDDFLSAQAVALIFGNAVIGKAGLVLVPLLVALATFGSAHSNIFTASREIFVAARDGMLPEILCGVHVSFKTPMPAVLLQSVISAVYILMGNIDQLINAFSAALWLFYALGIFGIFIMRITHKDKHRPFKVWLLLPSFMVLVSLFLVVLPLVLSYIPQLVAFAGILLGVPVYFLLAMEQPYKLRPSAIGKFAETVSNFLAKFFNTQSSRNSNIQYVK